MRLTLLAALLIAMIVGGWKWDHHASRHVAASVQPYGWSWNDGTQPDGWSWND